MHLHTVFSCSKHILKLSTIEQTDVRPHSRCKTSTETHDMLRQSCTHTHTHTLSHMPHHVRCVAVATERLTRSTMTSTQGRTVGRVCANISFPSYLLHLYEVMVAVKGRVWVLVPVWAAAGPLIYDVTPHQERQRRDRIWWIGAAELRDEHGPGQKSRTFTFSHIYCLRKLRLISCEEINTATV